MNFPIIFKDLRRLNNLTQQDFCNKLGVSRSCIAQIEAGNNMPSRNVLLKILESINVSEELRERIELFANGKSNTILNQVSSTDIPTSDRLKYNSEIIWETYRKILTNKKIILSLCISLKETHNYEFTVDDKRRLLAIENALIVIYNLAFGRIQFKESSFNDVIANLQLSDVLIDEYTNKILPEYSNTIRVFKDLFVPNEYIKINEKV